MRIFIEQHQGTEQQADKDQQLSHSFPPPVLCQEPITFHSLGSTTIEFSDYHALYFFLSEKLLLSELPKFGVCYLQGQVSLPSLPQSPVELRWLYTDPRD